MNEAIGEHDFAEVLRSSKYNIVEQARERGEVPKGYTIYEPTGGDVGHRSGGGVMVLPDHMVTSLKRFNIEHASEAIKPLEGGVRFFAKGYTVFNLANTAKNLVGDFAVSLHGRPGEGRWLGTTLGRVRFMPNGFVEAMRIVNRRASTVGELMQQHGVLETTMATDLEGHPIPAEMLPFFDDYKATGPIGKLDLLGRAYRGTKQFVGQGLYNARQVVEMTPRAAAWLESMKRTGSVGEATSVATEITLDYGNKPAFFRTQVGRIATPFAWISMATERIARLATTPGSRTRGWSSLLAIPAAVYLWNTRNSSFREVENKLPRYEQQQMHIIWADPLDPSKPLLNPKTKKPVVTRMQMISPSQQVLENFGLSNPVERAIRGAEGRERAWDLVHDVTQQTNETISRSLLFPHIIGTWAAEHDAQTGKKLTVQDKIDATAPYVRAWRQLNEEGRTQGVEGAEGVIHKQFGMGQATVYDRDTDLVEASRGLLDARARLKTVNRRIPPDPVAQRKASDEVKKAAARVNEINRIMKAQKAVAPKVEARSVFELSADEVTRAAVHIRQAQAAKGKPIPSEMSAQDVLTGYRTNVKSDLSDAEYVAWVRAGLAASQ